MENNFNSKEIISDQSSKTIEDYSDSPLLEGESQVKSIEFRSNLKYAVVATTVLVAVMLAKVAQGAPLNGVVSEYNAASMRMREDLSVFEYQKDVSEDSTEPDDFGRGEKWNIREYPPHIFRTHLEATPASSVLESTTEVNITEELVDSSDNKTEEEKLPPAPEVIYGSEAELQGKILFTIDDCTSLEVTRSMFETFRENGVKSVFFPNTDSLRNLGSVYGDQVGQLWKEMYRSGLVEIGYHTTDHEGNKTVSELNEDLAKFEVYMQELLEDPAYKVELVRPPYGTWDYNWLNWSSQNGLTTVRWNGSSGNTVEYLGAILFRDDGGGVTILHTRYEDDQWLKNNIKGIVGLVGEENIVLFSDVYDLKASDSAQPTN